MNIIPDIKATFGDTYFLGYTERMRFDRSTNKKTDEVEAYTCKISSSELQGQFDVIVPLTVDVKNLKFNEKILLQDVAINPYGKTSKDSTFVEMMFRCTAKNILNDFTEKHVTSKNEVLK